MSEEQEKLTDDGQTDEIPSCRLDPLCERGQVKNGGTIGENDRKNAMRIKYDFTNVDIPAIFQHFYLLVGLVPYLPSGHVQI